MLAGVSAALQRPARWTETRSESMQSLGHGRAQRHDVTIGGTRDGRVLAYRSRSCRTWVRTRAFGAIIPVMMTRTMAPGVYDIERVECSARSVVTNTVPVVAYRGAGRPEATAAIERAMDLFAAEIGMDPVEVRRRNLLPAFHEPLHDDDGQPSTTSATTRARSTSCSSPPATRSCGTSSRSAANAATWCSSGSVSAATSRSPARRSRVPSPKRWRASLIHGDGSATVFTGTSPHGQGHDTAWSMIAAEELGIAMERIEVVHGDTDLVPVGTGTFGSRSLQQGGAAVQKISAEVARRAPASSRPTCSRPASTTSSSTASRAGSMSPARPPVASAGASWRRLAAERGMSALDAEGAFVAPGPDVPVRRARRRRRGRPRDRHGHARPPRRVRRRRYGPEPAPLRRAGARRHRPGRRAGACRGVRL